ncbi:unnamed protein product [Caenorhabditis angaria]|uniref:Arylesterase n=1 Tax=Caenorhabditis angaria TaxID=860376 RepID=A0A9P1I4R9_9PELO|nr:unnamed protein product [Caenorhabditis angaria]
MSFYSIVHQISFWIILAFISSFIIRFILLMDPNKRVYNHTPGPCRVVSEKYKGTAGIHLVESQNRVYITYGYGRVFNMSTPAGIATFEVRKIDPTAQTQNPHIYDLTELRIHWNGYKNKSTFSPSGISSYSSAGRTLLYIIDSLNSCIQFFQVIDKTTISHRKAICDPEQLANLQDITVVGADRFYVSSLTFFNNRYLRIFELAMQSTIGKVYLYDGKELGVAIDKLASPSAIKYDSNRNLLYVSSFLNEVIRVYKVGKDLTLQLKTEISTLSSVVGIHIDKKSGDLWVACHPVLFQTILHYYNPHEKNIRSPSQILRIRMQEDGVSWVITEPYANDGATISSSHSLAYFEEQLLIGTTFGRLLHCDVLNPQIT